MNCRTSCNVCCPVCPTFAATACLPAGSRTCCACATARSTSSFRLAIMRSATSATYSACFSTTVSALAFTQKQELPITYIHVNCLLTNTLSHHSHWPDVFNYEKPPSDNPYFDESEQGIECSCPPECQQLDYSIQISAKTGQPDPELIELDVHFEQATMVQYRTSLVFDWMDLMGNTPSCNLLVLIYCLNGNQKIHLEYMFSPNVQL